MPNPSTILIVDDDAGGRSLLASLLQKDAYRLILASNGPEAIEVAQRERPDVVLLDVMMPGMDGYKVCQSMRALPLLQHVPILLLTALDDRASRLRGLEMGADDFLTKPFDPTELKMRLRTITRLNRFRLMYEERSLYERLVELAPDGIAVVDDKGRLIHCNEALKAVIGRDPLGEVFTDIIGPEGAAALKGHIAAVETKAKRPEPFETTMSGAANPATIVDIAAAPVKWRGSPGLQLVVRDITERKALESQVLRTQRIELLGQIAGGIVHDVNNLLTIVLGMTQTLELDATPESKPKLALISANTLRSASLLRQLLGFARGTDGEISPILAQDVLFEVAGMVNNTFDRSTIKLELDCSGALPVVNADPNQLHQILTNLCINARDAMPQGGTLTLRGAVRTVTEAQAPLLSADATAGTFVVLSVADTGEGIPPEVRKRLFDPFFTTKAPGKGTGLGLATVLRLARRHRGFVTVETEVGRGTTFACHLPVPQGAPSS